MSLQEPNQNVHPGVKGTTQNWAENDPKKSFWGNFSRRYKKVSLVDFIKLILSIFQKCFLVMTLKFFETTSDGVRSIGTVLISIKIQKIKILKI